MRVLVAYATKAGSTAEVAAEIGRVIGGEGDCVVDVRPVGQLKGIDGYDAVIVGSGIRAGRWLPEALVTIESGSRMLLGQGEKVRSKIGAFLEQRVPGSRTALMAGRER